MLVNLRVELLNDFAVEDTLIDRLAPDGVVAVGEDHLRHVARRQGERLRVAIDQSAEERLGFFLDGAIARRMNQSFAGEDPMPEGAERPIGKDEVGIEEDQVMVGHRLAEVGEPAMKRERQRHTVAALGDDQIVDGEESDWAALLDAPERDRVPDFGEKGLLGRSEEHTSELQSLTNLVCRLLLEK